MSTCFLALANSNNYKLDINMNSDTLEGKLYGNAKQLLSGVNSDNLYLGVGFLNPKDRSAIYSGLVSFEENVGDGDSVGLSLAAKFISVIEREKTLSAIAFGLGVEQYLPVDISIPVSLQGEIWYAPEMLRFSNTDRYFEYRVGLNGYVTQGIKAYIGYRSITAEISNSSKDKNYNSALHLGAVISF